MPNVESTLRRPCRIANCSGAGGDPGYQMRRQADAGDVDFITGDYLSEINLAENALAVAQGQHNGWVEQAWDGLEQTLDVIKSRNIKIIVNGGCLNPRGLAQKTQSFVSDRNLGLKVAYVYGDDLLQETRERIQQTGHLPPHLDSGNESINLAGNVTALSDTDTKPIVCAHAYLGARAIVKALELGADVVICGRVTDASPVIGAAWYWHNWADTDYDRLAGALIAGHLIECSAYATGSNFAGFDEFPLDTFVDLPFGIAEIEDDGTSIITKPAGTNGLVNVDNIRCQFLYELQGGLYLNPDVAAQITDIRIEQVAKDRVRLSNVHGIPPPPTTKLAIFYKGGYEASLALNATGYASAAKWQLHEMQVRQALQQKDLLDRFQLLDFQILGTPAANPRSQFASTTYCRIFIQADHPSTVRAFLRSWIEIGMQHYSGLHMAMDFRTAVPRPYLAYYPALYCQDDLCEGVALLSGLGNDAVRVAVQHPPRYQRLACRENYETAHPVELTAFGPTTAARLGDLCLARSGDKGANLNFGIFVRCATHYPWLQSMMTKAKLQELMGAEDCKNVLYIERMEFPNIWAVHFVLYGPLGRGVSGSRLVDALGKGFGDYIRDKVVEIPVSFLDDVDKVKEARRAERQ